MAAKFQRINSIIWPQIVSLGWWHWDLPSRLALPHPQSILEPEDLPAVRTAKRIRIKSNQVAITVSTGRNALVITAAKPIVEIRTSTNDNRKIGIPRCCSLDP
jgi:hypothetical protein